VRLEDQPALSCSSPPYLRPVHALVSARRDEAGNAAHYVSSVTSIVHWQSKLAIGPSLRHGKHLFRPILLCNAKQSVAASRLSDHDVEVSWSHRLEFFEKNFVVSLPRPMWAQQLVE